MPLGLVALGIIAAVALARSRTAHAAPALPPAPPNWQAYLPPIAAPEWARVAYAQAAASQNAVTMVAVANQLAQQGQMELAQALSAQYQALTNNPIPGIPTATAGAADPRIRQAVALLRLARRERLRRKMARVGAYLHAMRIARSA